MVARAFFARYLLSLLLLTAGANWAAAQNAAPGAAPNIEQRLRTAEQELRKRDYDAAEKSLLALEKDQQANGAMKAHIYCRLMDVYGAKKNKARETAYARKVLALPEAGTREKASALGCLAGASGFAARYTARYVQLRPEAEIERLSKEHIGYCQALLELEPTNVSYHLALARAWLERGEAEKAGAEFEAALAQPKLDPFQQGDALTGLASVALLKGDRAAAVRYCQDLIARNLETRRRYRADPVNEAKYAVQFLQEPELDYLKLPFDTGAKPFPRPQQATYTDNFVPLKQVALALGRDVKPDDVRIRLLKIKLARFGVVIADRAPFTISIGAVAEPRPPDRPEAYSLTVTKAGATINGHDAQGTLWGIVSFIQLVDRQGKPKVRICEVRDWPDTARRGFLQGYWKDALEFMLFCKLNTVVSQQGVQLTDPNAYLLWTPLEREVCARVSATFTAFGFRHYWGIRQWTMYPKLPLSSERTLNLQVVMCSEIASHGGHVYFPYDDGRFPLPQADLDKYGAAANIDAKYVSRLYQAVKQKYPDFHLVFCPPFYWGPDSPASYPEPREPYLKSLGDSLDPGVELFWTGPRVKGYRKTPAQVAWFARLTKRKPMIFQNGTGPHNTLSYITDETPQWRTWHYDGFFKNDIEAYLKNADMGQEAPQTATLADCLWNVHGYNAAASIRNAVAMLYGKDMFKILDPANQALAYLDKYKYGALTPEAFTEIPEIERRVKIADEAYNKGLAYNAFSLENFPGALGRGVGFAKRLLASAKEAPDLYSFAKHLLASAKNAPDFYSKYKNEIAETRKTAAKEVGVDAAKGDILKLPVDLLGGSLIVYDNRCPKRFATLLRGQKTAISRTHTSFSCDPFPPSGPYTLFVCAQDDDAKAQCRIRIKVNNTTLFEGPNKFVRHGWSVEKFAIPFDCLQRSNTLTIENLEDTAVNSGPPWFMVNYAVIKKGAK